ncbi:MAG: AI-2E family transporter [Planctomycetes bacterium]|nr:AI-2E family transporter [Planctomycetota bacterium]
MGDGSDDGTETSPTVLPDLLEDQANMPHEQVDWGRLIAILKRVGIWAIFLLLLSIFRDFFLLLFMTFIFAFIMNTMANFAARFSFLKDHLKLRVILAFLIFLGIWGLAGWYAIPQIKLQAQQGYETIDKYWNDIKEKDPEDIVKMLPSELHPLIGPTLQSEEVVSRVKEFGQEWLGNNGLEMFRKFILGLIEFATVFLLAIVFSFMILLDMPRLTAEIRKLEQTKLKPFFDEVSSSIVQFGLILGRTFQAQIVIAGVNGIQILIAMWVLDLPQAVFCSTLVFICSFVPVAGIFISSVPVCLIALSEGGIQLALIMAGLIAAVNTMEAYVLNPRIMGAALHMNPVLVLAILTVGHHMVGVWGLLLGVPVCYYFFAHAIWGDEPSPFDPASRAAALPEKTA